MVVSWDESLPDVGVTGHTVGADRMTSGADLTVTGTGSQWGRHLILRSARSGRSCGSLRSTSIACTHGCRSCWPGLNRIRASGVDYLHKVIG